MSGGLFGRGECIPWEAFYCLQSSRSQVKVGKLRCFLANIERLCGVKKCYTFVLIAKDLEFPMIGFVFRFFFWIAASEKPKKPVQVNQVISQEVFWREIGLSGTKEKSTNTNTNVCFLRVIFCCAAKLGEQTTLNNSLSFATRDYLEVVLYLHITKILREISARNFWELRRKNEEKSNEMLCKNKHPGFL